MARATTPPPPTLVLLVRHGQTPTTGQGPARAAPRACTSPTRASSRPRPSPSASPRCRPTSGKVAAVYASPLERTQETAAPIAKALGLRVRRKPGPARGRLRRVDRRRAEALYKLPEWRTVQRNPSGFRFPGRRVVHRDADAHLRRDRRSCASPTPGETVVAVSHADPIKAAVAHAMGTHLDLFQRIVVSPCSVSAILYGVDGPIVLAVNSTGDLTALVPVMSSFDLPAPDVFTAGTVGPPGQRVFYLQARDDELVVTVRCEKQQVAALADYFDGLLDDLEPAPYGLAAGDLHLTEPFEELWTVGPIGVAYDEPGDRIVVVLEELVDEETRRRGVA